MRRQHDAGHRTMRGFETKFYLIYDKYQEYQKRGKPMGWGELRAVPQHYSDEVRQIDEAMLRLYSERRRLAGRKRMFPPKETLEQWSEQFGLGLEAISRLLHSMNSHLPIVPPQAETPIGVLPIMKKAHAMDCDFLITHALQYETRSELTIQASFAGEADHRISLRPMLDLVVIGGETEYVTGSLGTSGGGMQAQLRYQIVPRLPDDLTGVVFSLVPGGYSLVHELKEIRLDRQVDFE
jgi:hypothetical protein